MEFNVAKADLYFYFRETEKFSNVLFIVAAALGH